MSFGNYKEKIERDAAEYRKKVFTVIKITFVVFAVLLFTFCISMVFTALKGDNKKEKSEIDTTPPIIVSTKGDRVLGKLGAAVSYRSMVRVSDSQDDNVRLSVNAEAVDVDKEGEYEVIFTARDSSGNTSTHTIIYIVKRNVYTDEEIWDKIGKKADELGITKSMKKTEQVKKIYDFVNQVVFDKSEGAIGKSNIPDINRDNWEIDWKEEAMLTLESRKGDCYSYYSLSKAFFEYLGIENRGIKRSERSEQDGTHFWSVVKVEDGWYYYDATRLAGKFSDGTKNACLITEAKLVSYRTSRDEDDFYTMDKPSDFPKISTTPIS